MLRDVVVERRPVLCSIQMARGDGVVVIAHMYRPWLGKAKGGAGAHRRFNWQSAGGPLDYEGMSACKKRTPVT